MRVSGGIRTQAAERRHPKHRAWERKRYSDNTPELAQRLHEARLRYPDGAIGFKVSAERAGYTITWREGPRGETVTIGTARDAATTAETLIICGLEPESQRIETVAAIEYGREVEIARQHGDGQPN